MNERTIANYLQIEVRNKQRDDGMGNSNRLREDGVSEASTREWGGIYVMHNENKSKPTTKQYDEE